MNRRQLFRAFLINAFITCIFGYLAYPSITGLPLFVALAASFFVTAYIFLVLFVFEGWKKE
jgi:hypothetical protein